MTLVQPAAGVPLRPSGAAPAGKAAAASSSGRRPAAPATTPATAVRPTSSTAAERPAAAPPAAPPAEKVPDVVELESSDSDFEILPDPYGPWPAGLSTNPRQAHYQLEVISFTLGPTSDPKTPNDPQEDRARPTECGVEVALEMGRKKFAEKRSAHLGSHWDLYPIKPAVPSSKPSVAHLEFDGKRPTFSIPAGVFEHVPVDEWPFGINEPGLRPGESARIRVELVSVRSRAGPLKALEWANGQLGRASSSAATAAQTRALAERRMPAGYVNVPVPVPTRRPSESEWAPLFWAGRRLEPSSQWGMRFRWRCNTEEAWAAKQELEKDDVALTTSLEGLTVTPRSHRHPK